MTLQRKTEEIIKEFEKTFPCFITDEVIFGKESDLYKGIIDFLKTALSSRDAYWLKKIEDLIVEEILICHKENTSTSRLTALFNKVIKLRKDY